MAKALVCGAGVGGLSAAAHLQQAGFEVHVFEMHPEMRTAGVGLNIWPNGVRVLRGLGLGAGFEGISSATRRVCSLDQSGRTTSDVDVSDWEQRYGAPLTGAHRRRLNELLASALADDEIHFGHAATSYEQNADEVVVHFADGGSAAGDVLIGADGVGSAIRNHMLGGEPAFTTDNMLRWRGVFTCADAGVEDGVQVDVIGDIGHFGWIPIGDGEAYWFGTGQDLTTREEFMNYFTAWRSTPVPRVIAATPEQSIINNTLVGYRDHLTAWTDGRVALLGDAAHPMFPGMAQGANQALEDGEALGRHLAAGVDVATAIARYESERIPLAHRMVELSRMLFDFDESNTAYAAEPENVLLKRYAHFERFRSEVANGSVLR